MISSQTSLETIRKTYETEDSVQVKARSSSCDIIGHTLTACSAEIDPESKLLLPETICSDSLERIAKTTQRSSMRKRYGGSPRYAHALIELALSGQTGVNHGNDLLYEASNELDRIKKGGIIPDKLKIEADILSAYVPAYSERISGNVPSTQIMKQTYQGLTALLRDYPDEYTTYQSIANTVGICIQAEIGALLMRTNNPYYFLWPASFREEDGQPKSLNHDVYGIRAGQKIPIQIKRTSEYKRSYDSRVGVIIYEALGFGNSITIAEREKNQDSELSKMEKWLAYDPDNSPPTAFRGIKSPKTDTNPDDFSPFVPHTMTHELTSALVSEAHHGYIADNSFGRIEAMTSFLKDFIDLSYAGPDPYGID